jgi:hypothetical protein
VREFDANFTIFEPADCTIIGGKLSIYTMEHGKGSGRLENCHMSGTFCGNGCVHFGGNVCVTMHRCTVQVRQGNAAQELKNS